MTVCARRWGSMSTHWDFCTRERGHEGACINSVSGAKRPDQRFWEDQPEAVAFNEKQRSDEQKMIARKGAPKDTQAV